MITVIFLGKLADFAGVGQCTLAWPDGALGYSQLIDALGRQLNSAIAAAAGDEKVKLALNGAVLPDKSELSAHDGDEIALLPPVSGG